MCTPRSEKFTLIHDTRKMTAIKNVLLIITLFFAIPGIYGDEKNPAIVETIKGMSINQKIGQMILVYHSPYSFLKKWHIGSVLIMSNMLKKPDKLAKEIKNIQKKMPIKLMVTIDQEGGKVNRLGRIKKWNKVHSAEELSHLMSDSITSYNGDIAIALVELGINVNLAPVLDPTHNFESKPAFMGENGRSFGKNAQKIVPPARAFIKGFTGIGVLCVSKHFPGYDVSDNSDHHIAISQADSNSVLINTLPFRQTIGEVAGIMMSSILYPKFAKHPAVFSPKIVGWARDLGPDKIIMTDDLWGAALRSYISNKKNVHPRNYPDKDFSRIVKLSFLAGNDILMITYPKKVAIIQSTIRDLCKKDPALIKRLDESVYRVLNAKHKIGLL